MGHSAGLGLASAPFSPFQARKALDALRPAEGELAMLRRAFSKVELRARSPWSEIAAVLARFAIGNNFGILSRQERCQGQDDDRRRNSGKQACQGRHHVVLSRRRFVTTGGLQEGAE
jgi:hypothetical protein